MGKYLRSFFDEKGGPVETGSMTRLCSFILVVAAAVSMVMGHDVSAIVSALCGVLLNGQRSKACGAPNADSAN